MARYYEETALIEFVKERTPTINGETTMECVERAIREAPTADVVPKSEVERLRFNLEAVLEEIPETKREVAREIFEEIENFITNEYLTAKDSRDIEGYVKSSVHYGIAELKKKYTGEEL